MCLQKEGSGGLRSGEGVCEDESEGVRGERNLVCAHCRNPVTVPSARVSVDGSHRHTFANPHGLVFHIGCFSDAPGCRPIGVPTAEFAWFAGFSWQVGLCARCGIHLGWRFDNGDRFFHGLIVDRLDEDDAGQSPEQP